MSNLKKIREDKNITQKELSERSGVNIQMIAKYEQGVKDINKAQGLTLRALANALACKIDDLMETN
jgi:transcriptional regulator with XRE-family HTH domain